MPQPLTDAERSRYSRHLSLPQVGEAGQLKLKSARVLLVGLGGLGSPCALYLAAAGVGTLGLADNDTVAVHNLQRQILHRTADTGRPKCESGAATLRALNPEITLVAHPEGVTCANARPLIRGYDIVVDGSDNFATRYLVNDAAALEGRALVAASVFRFEGQLSVYHPGVGGPCYRCLFPEPPPPGTAPGCSEAGVFGALCGTLGSLQAMEVVKIITGAGRPLIGRLLLLDALEGVSRTLTLPRHENCPCCGASRGWSDIEPARYGESTCATRGPVSAWMQNPPLEIGVEEARDWLVSANAPVLVDVREADEVEVCAIAGSVHIPMRSIPNALGKLPKGKSYLIHCHHGGRSLRVTEYLRAQGYAKVSNMKGGIDKWAVRIEPGMNRY